MIFIGGQFCGSQLREVLDCGSGVAGLCVRLPSARTPILKRGQVTYFAWHSVVVELGVWGNCVQQMENGPGGTVSNNWRKLGSAKQFPAVLGGCVEVTFARVILRWDL